MVILSRVKPQYANVSLHCADVSLHGADVSLHGADVSLQFADVSLQCKNTNITYINDKEHHKNNINENNIIKRKFIFIKIIFHQSYII